MKKDLLTEFVGTLLFVFAIALSVENAGAMAPLAIGAALMCVVYMGGHISGGHYNPAVSLAAYLRGAISAGRFVAYSVAQLAGAATAAALATAATGASFAAAPGAGIGAALLVEVVFTFALALVVLNTATDDDVAGNSFYGLAIGFTIVVAAFAGGPISGGAFNPAVGIGPALLVGAPALSSAWIYLVGPLAGGAMAAFVYRMQHPTPETR